MQQYALISDPDHCIEWLWAWLCDFCSSPSNKLSYTHSAVYGIPMLWNPASTVPIGVGTLPCTQCLKSSCISTAPSFLWAVSNFKMAFIVNVRNIEQKLLTLTAESSKIVHRRHTITPLWSPVLWSPVLCTAISYNNCAEINLGGRDVRAFA